MKYYAIAAALFLGACATPIEKLEAQIEKANVMNGLLCRSGDIQQWSYIGSHYDFITCASGQTFSIRKD